MLRAYSAKPSIISITATANKFYLHQMKSKVKHSTALICISAMYAGLLVGGKAALTAIPNVEIVTLLIALCAYCWGLGVALPAVGAFIVVETMFYGFNTWVISYIIHWNAVAVAFWLISVVKIKNNALKAILATVLAAVVTALFGVVTSLVDTLIGFVPKKGFFVVWDNFFVRFGAVYARGIAFYVTQIVCNIALFAAAFVPLNKVNQKAKVRLLAEDMPQNNAQSSPAQGKEDNNQTNEEVTNDLPQ